MAPTTTTTAKTRRTTTTTASFGNVGILPCIVILATLAQCCTAATNPIGDSDAQPIAAITRVKRMYALCPPRFQRVGQQCYYMSGTKMNWLDAHFDCKDRNSQLAEPLKLEDRRLRRFMQRNDTMHSPKWIGGLFNWQKNQWQWGYSGRDMDYQSFSQMMPGSSQDLKFHCAVLNADLKYRWSAKPCVERHHFVCQHNMPMVTDRNRHKVYAKWNASFPNEMANEMEVIVDDRYPGDRRRYVYQHSAAIAANTNSVRLTPPATRPATIFKPQHQKRRPDPFNNTLIGSNGRFSDRKISQSVNFGDPHRRGTLVHRRRPKSTTAAPSTTTTMTTASPDAAFNSLDASADRQLDDARRLADEQHTARIDAERRAKHKHDKEERRRRNRERKRQNELRRQQQHEQLLRDQQQRDMTTAAPAAILTSSSTTTSAKLSPMEQSEAIRLADTRRMLGIDGPATTNYNSRSTTASSPQTSAPATATTTAARPTTADSNNIADWDAERRDEEERRIRADEEQQRVEYERRQQEYQREQSEVERKLQAQAVQHERERSEQENNRVRLEQERRQKEELIAAEERDRKEQERVAEEERARDVQQRREREQQRQRDEAERKRAKEAKAAEIRRLKEKAMLDSNDTVAVLEAEAEQRRAADAALQKAQLEKKLKRDKIHEKLRSMTPEQQMRFYAKRAERNQKRQTPGNNDVVIPK